MGIKPRTSQMQSWAMCLTTGPDASLDWIDMSSLLFALAWLFTLGHMGFACETTYLMFTYCHKSVFSAIMILLDIFLE